MLYRTTNTPDHELRPSTSRLLQRVRTKMVEAWRAYEKQEFSPAERATHLLTIAVNELRRKPSPGEQQHGLFPNIRFAIFNYVPWKHFRSRTTVSYFNFSPTILQTEPEHNTRIVEMLGSLDSAPPAASLSHTVLLENEDLFGVDGDQFQVLWRRRWHEYLSSDTTTGPETRNFISWNEFLLSHAESPANLGVVWDRRGVDISKISGDYVIDETFNNQDPMEAYRSGLARFLDTKATYLDAQAVSEVQTLRRGCKPTHDLAEDCWQSGEAVERALIALYWGFGIWGARSFISIPVTYAASPVGQTGILSLGSVRPLGALELDKWSLIANCVLGTLLNLEAEARIIRSTTQYVYRVGHPFKNRSNSIARFSDNLIKDFNRLLARHTSTLSNELRHDLFGHLDDLKLLRRNSDNMSGFGSLVNFLSALSIEDDVWTDKRARRWLTKEPVNIRELLTVAATESFHSEDIERRIDIRFASNIDNLYFACRVDNGPSSNYIGRELLMAIFFEFIVNAIHHGKVDEKNRVVVDVKHSGSAPNRGLLITNRIDRNTARHEPSRDFIPYNIEGAGGETLAGHLLSELIHGSPKLRTRTIEDGEHYYFQYLIDLPVVAGTGGKHG